MGEVKLTKAQRAKLATTPDEWRNEGGDWKAGKVFLDLEDRGFVEMRLRSRSDISCGPGYHGSDWMIRRTPAGRQALGERE